MEEKRKLEKLLLEDIDSAAARYEKKVEAMRGALIKKLCQKEKALMEYAAAIEGFKKLGHHNLALSAKVYLAREAARAGYLRDAAIMVDALTEGREITVKG